MPLRITGSVKVGQVGHKTQVELQIREKSSQRVLQEFQVQTIDDGSFVQAVVDLGGNAPNYEGMTVHGEVVDKGFQAIDVPITNGEAELRFFKQEPGPLPATPQPGALEIVACSAIAFGTSVSIVNGGGWIGMFAWIVSVGATVLAVIPKGKLAIVVAAAACVGAPALIAFSTRGNWGGVAFVWLLLAIATYGALRRARIGRGRTGN